MEPSQDPVDTVGESLPRSEVGRATPLLILALIGFLVDAWMLREWWRSEL